MKKRNMSLILVLALILCLIPATAFADGTTTTWSGDITTKQTVTNTVTVSDEATIKAEVNVTTGKIVVKKGATLTIESGWLYLNSDGVNLEIEEDGTLVVNGLLYTKEGLGVNINLLGVMEVSGSNSGVITNHPSSSTYKIGGTANYQLQLGDGAEVIVSSIGETSADGYYYDIESGTVSTHNFVNTGADEIYVFDGAVLNATNGLTLNSQAGASSSQLTVFDGGKLKTNNNLASIFGATTAVTQNKITSGTYTENPKDYVAEGYTVQEGYNKDNKYEAGTYTVMPAGYLSKIAITLKEPVVGETPATTFKSTVEAKGSATPDKERAGVWLKVAKADYVDLYDDNAKDVWKQVKEGEKFQKGYYYAFITYFDITDGYEVGDYEAFENAVTVNGKKADYADLIAYSETPSGPEAVAIVKYFGPLAEKSPATGDNNELGLFAVAGLISALGVALMLRRKHSM